MPLTNNELGDSLLDALDTTLPVLRSMEDDAVALRPAPGKWSHKEIIGHLIDSAMNNHQRIVRARYTDDLSFPGYDQDAWVRLHEYQSVAWLELLTLWVALNRQLARAIASLDDDSLTRPRAVHNLNVIGWETVPAAEPVTLAYLVRDYVNHLRHHLRQIDPGLVPAPELQRR
jgi:hypothetical protein